MSLPTRPALPINCYTQRTAAKDGACFICSRLTPNLFMTVRGTPSDWFYVCAEHTSVTTFCTSTASRDSDIAQAKQTSPKDSDLANDATADATKSSASNAEPEPAETNAKDTKEVKVPPMQPKASTQFVLHKDYFYLRQRPFIKRWEQEQDKSFKQNFPSTPRGHPK
ncbi:hypothetical protein GGH13_004436 [Coemansia sp. S155-1]|nr:hypothetical protein GGH13_004436 [Coemansia sp. S155-1]